MEITLGDLRRIKLALPKEKHEQFVIGKQLELHERSRRNFLEQKRKLQSQNCFDAETFSPANDA